MSGIFAGALIGASVSMMSNGIRRIPVFSRPHAHALGLVIGGALGYKYGEAKVRMNEILEHEMRKAGRTVVDRR